MNIPIDFETRRTRVQLLQSDDRNLYCNVFTNTELTKYIQPLDTNRSQTSFNIALKINKRQSPIRRYFSVYIKNTDTAIGILGLLEDKNDSNNLEIGAIIKKEHQGNSYSTETLKALISYSLSKFPDKEIIARSMVENKLASYVAQNIGLSIKNEFIQDSSSWYLWSQIK